MEMKAGSLILQVVFHIDHHTITYIGGDCRYGPLTVDTDRRALESTIRVCDDPANVKIIGDGGGLSHSSAGDNSSGQTCLERR